MSDIIEKTPIFWLKMFQDLRNFFKKSASFTSKDLDKLLIYGPQSRSGVYVSKETALAQATVFACIRVLGESLGSLELNLYQRTKNGGKEKAVDHPLHKVLHAKPNDFQTSFGFREMLTGHTALTGAGFAFINRTSSGVAELLPIPPSGIVTKQKSDFSLSYDVTHKVGEDYIQRTYSGEQIFRVCGMTLDGVNPVSVLHYARETIGLAISAENYGGQVFENGAAPSGVVTHPDPEGLSPEAHKRLQDKLNEATTGANRGKLFLLDEGMDWKATGITLEDSQFLATRNFQKRDICGFFRMPPHKIGDLEYATFSNIEMQELQFYTGCLLAWLERWEQAIYCQLLTPKEQNKYFPEFNVASMLRGDIVSRYKAYQLAIMYGIMCPDEVRAMENLNPRPDGLGSVFFYPANLIPATEKTVLERDISNAGADASDNTPVFADNNNNEPAKGDNILREQQGKKRFLVNTYAEIRGDELRA